MIVKYFIYVISFGTMLVFGMYLEKIGPKYAPTKGEVWPKPQQENKGITYYTFNPSHFNIAIVNNTCEVLLKAVERYSYIITNNFLHSRSTNRTHRHHKILVNGTRQLDELYRGILPDLQVYLNAPCEEYPTFEMDERYSLKVSDVSKLESLSVWGIIRGLETFAQLFYLSPDSNEILINTTDITDFPSYPHRGLMLDTSRHYITVSNILKTLDAMAINKMNVFHWHIVDDQSFPYQSEKFPELSKKGAFHPLMVYTKEDIERIVQYARNRGIRVIPEFDVPGHTRSWGAAFPNVLTKCFVGQDMIGLGPIDPLSNDAKNLLKNLFEEVQQWFPDKYFHVGGDEVELECWDSNPDLQVYMRQNNLTAKDLHALFMRNAIPLLKNDTKAIVWQEVFDERVPLAKDTIVQVWKNQPIFEMLNLLLAGKKVLFSTKWYISHLNDEWPQYYKFDPRHMVYYLVKKELLSNIVGGEACMWGEMVDDRNLISRVWPRTSAVAEKLWTSGPYKGWFYRFITWQIPRETYHRMEEHACRMVRRGIGAQPPNGPGFCVP